jgi:hypothetical protein
MTNFSLKTIRWHQAQTIVFEAISPPIMSFRGCFGWGSRCPCPRFRLNLTPSIQLRYQDSLLYFYFFFNDFFLNSSNIPRYKYKILSYTYTSPFTNFFLHYKLKPCICSKGRAGCRSSRSSVFMFTIADRGTHTPLRCFRAHVAASWRGGGIQR